MIYLFQNLFISQAYGNVTPQEVWSCTDKICNKRPVQQSPWQRHHMNSSNTLQWVNYPVGIWWWVSPHVGRKVQERLRRTILCMEIKSNGIMKKEWGMKKIFFNGIFQSEIWQGHGGTWNQVRLRNKTESLWSFIPSGLYHA